MSSTKIRISERGKRLRDFRKLRGLSQARLAVEVGCTGGNISDIERGKSKGSNALIRAIERRFSINLAEINTPIYKEGDKDAGAIIEEPEDYGDRKRWRLVREIKRFAHEADPERDAKLINTLLENVSAFLELIEQRKTPREEE